MEVFSILAMSPVHAAFVASAFILVVSTVLLLILPRYRNSKGGKSASAGAALAVVEPVAEHDDRQRVRILYGTQTGTAERFSKQLANELRRRYGSSTLIEAVDLEKYKAGSQLQKETFVIFCVATYGEGEPTDNAAEFYSWLLQEVDAVEQGSKDPFLQGLNYCVFGLGNKQYEHFCSVGKKVFKSLGALGGKALVKRGDGDDDGDIDQDFDNWCDELYKALDTSGVLGSSTESAQFEDCPDVTYDACVLASTVTQSPPFSPGDGSNSHAPFQATVSVVKELHSKDSDRSCVHVELDVSKSSITYEHGDHVGIYCQNPLSAVEKAASCLGVPLDTVFKLTIPPGAESTLHEPFPTPTTIKTALTYFADLFSSPSQAALLALSRFACTPEEGAKLKHLSLHSSKQEYVEYVVKSKRSLLEVMQDFPSAKPTLGAFFSSICPRLQPRLYSISSSPKQYPNHIHVTCAVVSESFPTGRLHEGVCSTWLKGLGKGAIVPVFVRSNHFKLPTDPTKPVIMIGPGTGLAPFRGFIQERSALKKAGTKLGVAELYFGCRNKEHDYIYQDELLAAVIDGAISDLHVAFSREQSTKDYVQHHMDKNASQLWQLIDGERAQVYVCGDAKHMAKDVHNTLVRIVKRMKSCNDADAELYVKQMQERGAYHRDVW